jgi:hypothetical protein
MDLISWKINLYNLSVTKTWVTIRLRKYILHSGGNNKTLTGRVNGLNDLMQA